MDMIPELITAVTVNYKTIDVTRKCLQAIKLYYPDIRIIIIDNSNYDVSSDYLYKVAKEGNNITTVFNTYNMHHGPSIDLGIRMIHTPYAFVLDSDAYIRREGVLEAMLQRAEGVEEWLMVGDITPVDKNGFDIKDGSEGIPYGDPKCMLLNKACYLTLPPFIRHGAPCIETMTYLNNYNKTNLLLRFPWTQYVYHAKGATQRRFGLDGDGLCRKPDIPPYT